ncbi:linear amide C-N hydrolase [Aliidiomarina halalkaliphila]|uniref:Linear amide C-N hydrolase n=1 Tax=Aliidiomarina halalkaliphila TaxID=2593535 RepID=A0A552X1H7_9GAMM|nr:linear amide C-N hydrolase [Aliidiomarina halalkaliphila]TRW48901.1 linear amide C-N hydrolase [Aliidiomarina halalkaliphila]
MIKKLVTTVFTASLVVYIATPTPAEACTRLVYLGPDNTVLTGRSMDFSIDIPANLWIFPRGMERQGEVGPNSITWRSKYGSVAASSWDIATPDGMNEKGLVANLLWLVASEYPDFEKDGDQPGLTISAWAQYALDNFATVAEAVDFFAEESFAIVSDFIPGTDKFTTVHLSLSDATGDSAIFEYIGGKLKIHHSRDYQVMTNDPPFGEQLAIKSYWDTVPGQAFLPGTGKAADRFVRASYYLNMIPQTSDPRIAAASVFSVVRNVSVPYGIGTPEQPHLSNTRWRVVSDQRNLVYYFENVLTPNTVWVDFNNVDFSEGAPVKKLELAGGEIYAGESSGYFAEAEPFRFQGL